MYSYYFYCYTLIVSYYVYIPSLNPLCPSRAGAADAASRRGRSGCLGWHYLSDNNNSNTSTTTTTTTTKHNNNNNNVTTNNNDNNRQVVLDKWFPLIAGRVEDPQELHSLVADYTI